MRPTLSLGRFAPYASEVPTTNPTIRDAGRALRILVADADPADLNHLVAMIEELGHVPAGVSDGVQAVRSLLVGRYDVVLLDCDSAEVDGLDVVARMKNNPTAHRVPIIGIGTASKREAALASGMAGYVATPVQIDALAGELNAAMVAAVMTALPAIPHQRLGDQQQAPAPNPTQTQSQTTTPTPGPTLAPAAVERLRRMTATAGPEIVAAQLTTAVTNIWLIVGELQLAVAAHDVDRAVFAGQRLAGLASPVGAHELEARCSEFVVAWETSADLRQAADRIREAADRAVSAITAVRQQITQADDRPERAEHETDSANGNLAVGGT